MSIVLVGSTSGSVTLQEPAVAGTTVLTLPAVSGTVLTTTSPKAGNVIQVVNATSTSTFSTTSTSFVTTGFSASITPTSSSSKILALLSANGFHGSSSAQVWVTLYRGATELSGATNGLNGISNGAGGIIGVLNFSYLDSPATTSSTTYTIYIRTSAGTGYFNSNNSLVTLQLLEIAA
jgi:hypothetical protein